MKRPRLPIITALFLLSAMPAIVHAQDDMAPMPPPGMQATPPQAAPSAPAVAYTQQQLDQMVAPVALYPDPLLSQILMASTYPLEVVEAERWLQDPANAGLQGDDLAAALQQQPWDPSVKSLVAVPQVLKTMNDNLQWTEQLGDAFLAQQAAVMDSVQHLRGRAQTAGTLRTTPQQVVSAQGPDVIIEPANPEVVYVPVYNPTVVYGAWPWPGYMPYYFPGYAYAGIGIGFGIGFGIVGPFWGWDHWDWYDHRIDIDDHRWAELNRGFPPRGPGGFWQHDPDHRRGVPYRDAATRARFQGVVDAEARRNYRGYGANATASGRFSASAATRGSSVHAATTGTFHGPTGNVSNAEPHVPATTSGSRSNSAPAMRQPATTQRSSATTMRQSSTPSTQRSVPAFESFSHGSDVRSQSARGASSRSTMPSGGASRGSASSGGEHGGGENDRNR